MLNKRIYYDNLMGVLYLTKLRLGKGIALILITLTLLCGCNIGGSNLINKAKQSDIISTAGLSKTEIADYDYGEIAYKYLEYIQEALPGRVAFTQKEQETAAFILSALMDMGYTSDSIRVQPLSANMISSGVRDSSNGFDGGEKVKKSQNIIVTKKGASDKVIIVAAHYDSVGTYGVDDNGSGVSIVLENAMRMVDEQIPYTIRYIFFGAEETALMGSRYYLKSLSDKEKDNIVFLINIDSVIGGDTCFISGGEIQNDGTVLNDWAVLKAYEYVESLRLDIHLPSGENEYHPFPVGTLSGDHVPFMEEGIPYIHFDGVNWDSGHPVEAEGFDLIMHSPNDDLDFLNNTFPNRVNNALSSYSMLLEHIIKNLGSTDE